MLLSRKGIVLEEPSENIGDHFRKQLARAGNHAVPAAENTCAVGKLHLHDGVGLFKEEHPVVTGDEVLHHLHRQRVRRADFQYRDILSPGFFKQIRNNGERNAGGDDAEYRLLLRRNLVVVL